MKTEVYVLYLQFENKLDEKFLYLSRIFNQFGIQLVPISLKDFKALKVKNHEYVIACVKDVNSFKEYRKILKRYLNYFLRTGKITLFEFSSFETLHDTRFLKEGKVFQERLPVSMFQITELIGRTIYQNLTVKSKVWPGGRKVRLPAFK
jgi:hypothetical protein